MLFMKTCEFGAAAWLGFLDRYVEKAMERS